MATLDRAAERPAPPGMDRIRLSGWSPGTGTMLGAWIASAAIARLTGAAAVFLVLAAALVAMVFEIVAGWWALRSAHVRALVAPTVANVGERVALLVELDAPSATPVVTSAAMPAAAATATATATATARATATASAIRARTSERRRFTLTMTDGTDVSLPPGAGRRGDTTDADRPSRNPTTVAARFDTPGVVPALVVRVDMSGPAGLIWWKRSRTVAIDPLHVAPIAAGPPVAVESSASAWEGSVSARRGNHGGEIDGVRPWRQGDATNSVHWASSLRTDELIVHDRLVATDQRWLVDLDAAEPSRLRWTLDEGRRHGHVVAVRTGDGAEHVVRNEDDAARWSAIAAQVQRARDVPASGSGPVRRSSILRRPVRLQPPAIVADTAIAAPARWAAAAAAFASIAMLVGTTETSAGVLALVLVAVVAGAAVSLWVARRSGRRPVLMQLGIVGVLLVAFAVIASQAVDVDGLLAALRGPLPQVLMLLVVLHGFEVVDRRTLRVHLAITFVLACYAAGLRIDSALGWWLAAWSGPFVMSLLTTSREPGRGATRGPRNPGTPRHPSARQVPSGVWSVRTTGRWIVSFVAIGVATLAVLSLVPIPDGPARLGLPALSSDAPAVDSPGGLARPDGSTAPPTAERSSDRAPAGNVVGYPGFTETLDTSVRGELGDQIVMRVRAPEPAFWRGQTFTEFDGRTWTVSPELGQSRTGPVIDVPATVGDAVGATVPSRELVQTYFVEQDLPNVVFAAPRAEQVIFDGSLWTRPDGALRSDVTLTAGSVYTVISRRPQVDAAILRAQGDLGELFDGFREMAGGDQLDPFLELPESTTQRTIDLATTLRTPGESTYDTILAYEAWLGANTEYDLDAPVPADGADAVDDFLFESQLGFCEQIATALTIMLRSQGVPARLATGYVPGERDRVSGVWNVRGSDAHAWVEVWFPQTGWQPFDPTADVPLAADAGGDTIGADLIGATVSSILSYRVEIGMTALAVGGAFALARLVVLARYRRRRGRWGLLQDRFGALASACPTAPVVATNAQIASAFTDAGQLAAAQTVADELDRAGFDPVWVDDDDRYEQARSALATLERSKR